MKHKVAKEYTDSVLDRPAAHSKKRQSFPVS